MHEFRDWKNELENESNFNKRKIIVFDHLDSIGIDTSN